MGAMDLRAPLSVHFAYPGALETPTGGYVYDRAIVDGMRTLGHDVHLVPLGADFPFPTTETRRGAAEALAELPDDALVVVDGLAFGILDDVATQEARRLRLIALVHHPLARETGLSEPQTAELAERERMALAVTRGIVVTSPATAAALERDYAVAAERIAVVPPGICTPTLPRRTTLIDSISGE